MELFFIALGVLGVVIMVRLVADQLDRSRIRGYVQERGGEVLEITWAPFGRGWFGEEKARIYRVSHADADGAKHTSICKTRLFGGVYWTEKSPG
jgi:hypothetical protein